MLAIVCSLFVSSPPPVDAIAAGLSDPERRPQLVRTLLAQGPDVVDQWLPPGPEDPHRVRAEVERVRRENAGYPGVVAWLIARREGAARAEVIAGLSVHLSDTVHACEPCYRNCRSTRRAARWRGEVATVLAELKAPQTVPKMVAALWSPTPPSCGTEDLVWPDPTPIYAALRKLTGQRLPNDPKTWHDWLAKKRAPRPAPGRRGTGLIP